jgi:hypothetical protein
MVFLVVHIVVQNHIRNQNPTESQVILIKRKAILLIGIKAILAVGEVIQLEQEATEDESRSIIFNSFD